MKPTLDSRQLHAFAALARRGSFTLAAKDLFLTQSAVSHAIKALEDDVGCRLLDRVGRRVLLTQAGEQFLRHTEKILREMEAARAASRSDEMGARPLCGSARARRRASTFCRRCCGISAELSQMRASGSNRAITGSRWICCAAGKSTCASDARAAGARH